MRSVFEPDSPWKLLLAANCLYFGISAVREFLRARAVGRFVVADPSSARERGRAAGLRTSFYMRVVLWAGAASGVLAGWAWILPVVALALVFPVRQEFRDYAQGFAEGRRAGELAAAVEYVQGRVPPDPLSYASAMAFVLFRRGIPLAAAVFMALWRTP